MKNGLWNNCAFYLLILAFGSYAQNEPNKSAGCAKGGAVFGIDPLGRTLMLKDRTGYLTSIELPSELPIWKLQMTEAGQVSSTPVRMKFEEILTNDLVCIEGDIDAKKLSKATVVPRGELEQSQRNFALKWQSESVFGSILTIDAASRKLTVMPMVAQSSPSPTEINLPAEVLFRTYPSTAMRINDAGPIRFEDLQTGDRVYIRGRRMSGTPILDANLVIKGGMRAILGTLLEVGGAQVRIREYGTGRTLAMSIPSTLAYRTTAELKDTSGAVKLDESRLAMIRVSDLQIGDTVLVVGTTDDNSNTGNGLGVVAHFGYFGSSPIDGGGQQITWILK
jgi:hypothetical protein